MFSFVFVLCLILFCFLFSFLFLFLFWFISLCFLCCCFVFVFFSLFLILFVFVFWALRIRGQEGWRRLLAYICTRQNTWPDEIWAVYWEQYDVMVKFSIRTSCWEQGYTEFEFLHSYLKNMFIDLNSFQIDSCFCPFSRSGNIWHRTFLITTT